VLIFDSVKKVSKLFFIRFFNMAKKRSFLISLTKKYYFAVNKLKNFNSFDFNLLSVTTKNLNFIFDNFYSIIKQEDKSSMISSDFNSLNSKLLSNKNSSTLIV